MEQCCDRFCSYRTLKPIIRNPPICTTTASLTATLEILTTTPNQKLQEDLNRLTDWKSKWQKSFKYKECIYIYIYNARSHLVVERIASHYSTRRSTVLSRYRWRDFVILSVLIADETTRAATISSYDRDPIHVTFHF